MTQVIKIVSFWMVLLALASCSSMDSQENTADLKEQFNQDFEKYFDHMNNEEWEEVMEMTNPNLFKIAPKKELINLFSSLKESGIMMNVSELELKGFSEITEFKGAYYTKINYNALMTMQLNEVLIENIDLFKSELYKSYPEEDVKVEIENKRVLVDADKYIIAMSMDDKKSWTYFEVQPGQKEILDRLVPPVVLAKLLKDE